MELKNIVKNHLTEKKETDRLKRVEANEKLEKITLLTNGTPYCDTVKDYLNQEGIRYNEKTIKDNPKDIDRASSITNLSMFPMVYHKDMYLVFQRDFQNPQQLVQTLQHLAKKSFENPKSDIKVQEQIKTMQYHIWTKINNLESKITPVLNILNSLSEEIKEEENNQ
jgi:glutaredoxin